MDLLLISGVSGSGKSVALAALEDSGYYVVNNLPSALLPELVHFLAKSAQQRVAVALAMRSPAEFAPLIDTIEGLKGEGWNVRLVFLEARTETLTKRFSETRRKHPYSGGDRTLTEAIEYERAMLAPMSEFGYRFDTSDLPPHALRAWVRDFVSVDASQMALLLQSFGFKHGVPLDSDLVFDVRCLPNPHYDPALSPFTGKDATIVEFLEGFSEVERMYADIHRFVAGWLPNYTRDARAYLTVSIGCTGGRHRSVYFVERLATALAPRYRVLKRHRELD